MQQANCGAREPSLMPPASSAEARIKRKRPGKEDNEPLVKKTPAVVVFSPEMLHRIFLSRNILEQWCHTPYFATTVTGCFVRVAVKENSSSNPQFCLAEIVSVVEMEGAYKLGSTRTNLAFQLMHAASPGTVTLMSTSNEGFTSEELLQWEMAMMAARKQFPTLEKIAKKEEAIQAATSHVFTQRDIDYIVARKSKFQLRPLVIAKKKIDLLESLDNAKMGNNALLQREIEYALSDLNEQAEQKEVVRKRTLIEPKGSVPSKVSKKNTKVKIDDDGDDYERNPFVRRPSRPILVPSLKVSAVRNAVYNELDSRYGFGYTPEETTYDD